MSVATVATLLSSTSSSVIVLIIFIIIIDTASVSLYPPIIPIDNPSLLTTPAHVSFDVVICA